MRDARHQAIVLFLLALAAFPTLAEDDVMLSVEKGAVPGEFVLEWSGGTTPYRAYRAAGPIGVAATPNLIGETASTSLVDVPGAGDAYYLVRSVPTVFRITDLDLMDPHFFVLVLIFCTDITNSQLNPELQNQISGDADLDGLLDLSAIIAFRPLDQGAADGCGDFGFADCTAPVETTVCDQNPTNPPVTTTYSNITMGTCLAPVPGTTTGYSPPIVSPVAPPTCAVSDPAQLVFVLGGAAIPFEEAQAAANYVGDPAGSLANGLLRGFISEAVADVTMVDLGLGPQPLSSLLPGGQGSCASGDDRDLGPDGETLGWWFYFNFSAEEVAYAGP